MSIEVRKVSSSEDFEECLRIRREVFIKGMNVPEEHEVDAFEEEATHFLALYDGKPAATGRTRLKKGFVKFERIATLSEFRGKGLASALMKAMQQDALKKHSEYLPAMHAQVSAISFYLKLGWVNVGKVFVEADIDHQMMILPPKDISKLKCLNDPETPKAILEFFNIC